MTATVDPLSTRVDPEEIERTTSEKALAVALAAFVFIAGIWGYVKLAEVDRPERGRHAEFAEPEPAQGAALEAESEARRAARDARRELSAATQELTLRREEYRTALDAGEDSASLRASYTQARTRLESAQARARRAAEALDRVRPAAESARDELRAAQQRRFESARSAQSAHDRTVLLLRLALVIGMAAAALVLLSVLRSRRSRYLPLAVACLGACSLLAIVLAADYSWGEFTDISDLGPLLLAIAGVAMTLAAYFALQRYLSRRLPIRRARRRECPFCGFPGEGPHCEGCGRRLVGECAECNAPRRIGTPHCAACGKA